MDADVMITIVFVLEVFLFGLAFGVFVVHEAGKARAEAAAENGRERLKPAAIRTRPSPSKSAKQSAAEKTRPAIARSGRPVRGLRS
jgi:hypothetical protein